MEIKTEISCVESAVLQCVQVLSTVELMLLRAQEPGEINNIPLFMLSRKRSISPGASSINDDGKADRRRMKRGTMRLLCSVVTNFTVNKIPRQAA